MMKANTITHDITVHVYHMCANTQKSSLSHPFFLLARFNSSLRNLSFQQRVSFAILAEMAARRVVPMHSQTSEQHLSDLCTHTYPALALSLLSD